MSGYTVKRYTFFFYTKEVGGPLPLPDFTHTIKYALRNGDSITVWNTMIDQAYNFYSANYIHECDGIAVYQQIGRDMYRKYRSIQREGKNDNLIAGQIYTMLQFRKNYNSFYFTPGKHPWSYFTRCLSQKLRAHRYNQKRRSNFDDEDDDIPVSPACKRKLAAIDFLELDSDETTDKPSKTLEEYEEIKESANREVAKNNSTAVTNHILHCLQETFSNRYT